jgi:excisionase family DNA binding protein
MEEPNATQIVPNPELLTTSQLADRLHLTDSEIRKLVQRGRIPEIKVSERTRRYDWAEVVEALKERHDTTE